MPESAVHISIKSPEDRQAEEIQRKADRLSEIQRQQEQLKTEAAELEGFFLKLADQDLRNTKLQTVRFSGSGGNRIQATMAQTVKVIYPSLLEKIFGAVYADVVTVDMTPKYKLSAPASRMIAGLYLKKYTEISLEEVIRQAAPDEKSFNALRKKIKGASFTNDKKNLMAIAGLNEQSAEEYAYFAAEAAVWEDFQRLLAAGGMTEEQQAGVMGYIDTAVTVEETPKITVETGA